MPFWLICDHITGQTLEITHLDDVFPAFTAEPNVGLLQAMCAQLPSCRRQLSSFLSV